MTVKGSEFNTEIFCYILEWKLCFQKIEKNMFFLEYVH